MENSEAMREVQSQTLSPRIEGKDVKLNWYTSVEEIPESRCFSITNPSICSLWKVLAKDEFTLFVAHEFFDAMPINVFEKTDMGWREVLIDRDPSYSPEYVILL